MFYNVYLIVQVEASSPEVAKSKAQDVAEELLRSGEMLDVERVEVA